MVFFGESHGVEKIIEFQKFVQAQMIADSKIKLNVILEHFSFEMQSMLDGY
jgi:uncharacterized iron-regulated protein